MARNPVSATVYVWLPYDPFGKGHSVLGNIGAYGHAAMQVLDSSGKAFTNNYVSWWPEGSAGRSSILPGKKFAAQKITSHMDDNAGEKVALGQMSHSESWMAMDLNQNRPDLIEGMIHGQYIHRFFGISESKWPYEDDIDSQIILAMERVFKAKYGQKESQQHMKPWVFDLQELDCLKMQAEWGAIKSKKDAHYRTLRKNCSTVVARVLRAGGVGKHSGFFSRHHAVWTPHMIWKLCQEYQKKSASRRVAHHG